MNRLATIRAAASNFLICDARDRATCSVSPFAVTWLTSPTESALLALILRPVSSKSRTKLLLRSRLRRGIPLPSTSPSVFSAKGQSYPH